MSPADFLARAARKPFAWDAFNCCLWLADWVAEARGFDPAADLRTACATALGRARILRRGGGVLGVVASCANRAGLISVAAPEAGAIGVVEVETDRGPSPAGAICTGPRWAVLGVCGLIVAPYAPLAAWSV